MLIMIFIGIKTWVPLHCVWSHARPPPLRCFPRHPLCHLRLHLVRQCHCQAPHRPGHAHALQMLPTSCEEAATEFEQTEWSFLLTGRSRCWKGSLLFRRWLSTWWTVFAKDETENTSIPKACVRSSWIKCYSYKKCCLHSLYFVYCTTKNCTFPFSEIDDS